MSIRKLIAPFILALHAVCLAQSTEVNRAISETLTSIRTQLIQEKDRYLLLSRVEESKIYANRIFYGFSYEQGILKPAKRRSASTLAKENGVKISVSITYPLDTPRPNIPNYEITFADQSVLTCSSYVVVGDADNQNEFKIKIESLINSEIQKLIQRLSKLGGRLNRSGVPASPVLKAPPKS